MSISSRKEQYPDSFDSEVQRILTSNMFQTLGTMPTLRSERSAAVRTGALGTLRSLRSTLPLQEEDWGSSQGWKSLRSTQAGAIQQQGDQGTATNPSSSSDQPGFSTERATTKRNKLWNPLPGHTELSNSTTKDAFQWRLEEGDNLDMTHHRQKTDFSQYAEVAARFMDQLVTKPTKAHDKT